MPLAGGCIAGRSFITLFLSLLWTICSSIALRSAEANRSETKEQVTTRRRQNCKAKSPFRSGALHAERLYLLLALLRGSERSRTGGFK